MAGTAAVGGGYERPGVEGVMAAALAAARNCRIAPISRAGWQSRDAASCGWRPAALKDWLMPIGLAPRDKTITPAMEKRSRAFHAGFLRGLFDTDGSVQGSQAKGVSIRLAQSDLPRLAAAQRMLARLGIMSNIYRERRPRGLAPPARRQGRSRRNMPRVPQHELIISRREHRLFMPSASVLPIDDKSARLAQLLQGYKRALNGERFVATVESVEPEGEAEVFDAAIPGLNAFDANGLWAHNCGEQPLPPYGACLLGSVNLACLVIDPFTDEARLDEDELARLVPLAVRFMDNVVDVSNYPLAEQRQEALAKRRIGLGLTGLADALAMCGLRYGSDAAASRRGSGWRRSSGWLIWRASRSRARRGRFRSSTSKPISPAAM